MPCASIFKSIGTYADTLLWDYMMGLGLGLGSWYCWCYKLGNGPKPIWSQLNNSWTECHCCETSSEVKCGQPIVTSDINDNIPTPRICSFHLMRLSCQNLNTWSNEVFLRERRVSEGVINHTTCCASIFFIQFCSALFHWSHSTGWQCLQSLKCQTIMNAWKKMRVTRSYHLVNWNGNDSKWLCTYCFQ